MAPYSQWISPRSSAIPSIRACIAASVPSACHRCNQRCVALFDAHCGPQGTSHQRQPGDQHVEQGMQDLPKRDMRHPTAALRWCRGNNVCEQAPFSITYAFKSSCHTALLCLYRTVEHKIIIVGYIHVTLLSLTHSPFQFSSFIQTSRLQSSLISGTRIQATLIKGTRLTCSL